jgi:hypothetical protein
MSTRAVPIGRLAGTAAVAAVAALGCLGVIPANAAAGGGNTNPLPPNTFQATGPLPTPGAHGPAFAPLPKSAPKAIVQSSDYPSVVAVLTGFTQNGRDYVEYCTGTVLTPTRVLTAANCDTAKDDATTMILAGDSAIAPSGNGGYADQVVSTWNAPDFAGWVDNSGADSKLTPAGDATVLSLATALPAAYPPIALTAQGDQTPYATGTKAVMVGYSFDPQGDGYLQTNTEPLKSAADCAAAEGSAYSTSTMACGGQSTGSHYVCDGDQGGPLMVNGKEAGIVAGGSPDCRSGSPYVVATRLSSYTTAITAAAALPPAHNQDATGDGQSDLLGRTTDGHLDLYSGSGVADPGRSSTNSGLSDTSPTVLGSGFGQYAASNLTRDVNWNGLPGTTVLGVAPNGTLTRWTVENGSLSAGTTLATGWTGVQRLIAVDNYFAPGRDALLTVQSDGTLIAHELDGHGGLIQNTTFQIGTGWLNSTGVLDVGDFLHDGHTGILSRKPDGTLWLFETTVNEPGVWVNAAGQQVASGWNYVVNPVAVGDWNGDDEPDLMGVDTQGGLWLTTTDGKGDWTSVPSKMADGLTGLNLLF